MAKESVAGQDEVPGMEVKERSVSISPLIYVPQIALGGQAKAVVKVKGPAHALTEPAPQSART
jgi:hypothetical protein